MAKDVNLKLKLIDGASKALDTIGTATENLKKKVGDLDTAGKKLQGLGSGLSVGLTAPILAAGAALGALLTRTAAAADGIDKLSERTGISRQSLQELQYAASQTGVDFKALDGISAAFAGRLLTMEGGTNAASQAFEDLGLSTTDVNGKLKTSGQVLEETIEALAGIEDPAERGTAAIALLGPEGAKLAPLLNAGADGIQNLRDRAQELGVVLSDEAIAGLVGYTDAVDDVKKAFAGLGNDIITEFMPIIQNQIVPFIKNQVVPALRDFAEGVANIIRWFTDLSEAQQKVFGAIVLALAASGPLLMGLGSLVRAVNAVKGAFLALSLSNPVGWIALAITAIASLAAILYFNKKDSVTTAAERAADKMASGDKDSFVSGLDTLVEAVDEDARPALEDLREDFIQTGTVSVEQAQRIKDAFAQAFVTERIADQTRNILGAPVDDSELGFFKAIGRHTGIDYYQMFMDAVSSADFELASEVLSSAEQAASQLEQADVWGESARDYAISAISLYEGLLQEALSAAETEVATIVDSIGEGLGAASTSDGNRGNNGNTTNTPGSTTTTTTPPVSSPTAETQDPREVADARRQLLNEVTAAEREQAEAAATAREEAAAREREIGEERLSWEQEVADARRTLLNEVEAAEREQAAASVAASESSEIAAQEALESETAIEQARYTLQEETREGERAQVEASLAAREREAESQAQIDAERLAEAQALADARRTLLNETHAAEVAQADAATAVMERAAEEELRVAQEVADARRALLNETEAGERAQREAAAAAAAAAREEANAEFDRQHAEWVAQQEAAIAAAEAAAIAAAEAQAEALEILDAAFDKLKSNIRAGANVVADFIGNFKGMETVSDSIRFAGEQLSSLLQIIRDGTAAQEAYRVAAELAATSAVAGAAAMKLATMDIIGLVIQAIAWIVQLINYFVGAARRAEEEARRIEEEREREAERVATEWMNRVAAIANSIYSTINTALHGAIWDFIRNEGSLADIEEAFRVSVYEGVLNAIIDSVINAAVIQGALGGLLEKIADASAAGNWNRVNDLLTYIPDAMNDAMNNIEWGWVEDLKEDYGAIFTDANGLAPDVKEYEALYNTLENSASEFGTFASQAVSLPLYDASIRIDNASNKMLTAGTTFERVITKLINEGITAHVNSNVNIKNTGIPSIQGALGSYR